MARQKLDIRFGKACYDTNLASFSRHKRELSRKTKLLMLKLIFIPIPTYSHWCREGVNDLEYSRECYRPK